MRALSRSRSRPQLGAAQVAASTRDAVEDAPRAVHHDCARDALRVEGHERASRRAQRVVGGVAAVGCRVACEAAEAASREGAHAAERLVDEQLHRGLLVLDGVDVVTCVVSDEAGAGGMVKLAEARHSALARAEDSVFEALCRVAHAVLMTVQRGACDVHATVYDDEGMTMKVSDIV